MMFGPGFLNLPKFLATANYQNPMDVHHSNWQHLQDDDMDSFQWIAKDPERSRIFQGTMEFYSASKPLLTMLYPLDELFRKAKKDRIVFVDMGGGAGHDIEKVRASVNAPPGSCVLQDLPGVIEHANVSESITKMAHDLFTPQPVKGTLRIVLIDTHYMRANRAKFIAGAAAYYLHIVLHDWPDDQAIQILKNTVSAMERGYSRILLQETVLNSEHPHPRSTASDLTMMTMYSAKERTEKMWNDLASASGLEIVKVWSGAEDVDGGENVIELSLP